MVFPMRKLAQGSRVVEEIIHPGGNCPTMVAPKTLCMFGQTPSEIPVPDSSIPAVQRMKRGRSWIGFIRDLFIYMSVYLVVSGATIGPFVWIWFGAMYADGPKWFAQFYLPLAYLCEICPPLRWAINTWVDWWIL